MDAKKFGQFISALRKEKNMTQADLAKKLQVTDKAVSRWERGLGFPDINSIEPLAEALGVSVLEIMRSKKIKETAITQNTVSAALTDALELAKLQRKAERKSIVKMMGVVVTALLMIFLIDSMGWIGFAMVCFPVICLLGGMSLTIYGIWRKKNKLRCLQTFTLAVVMLLVPAAITVFFFLAGYFGLGPIPN